MDKPKFYMTMRHVRIRLSAIEDVLSEAIDKINTLHAEWKRFEEED